MRASPAIVLLLVLSLAACEAETPQGGAAPRAPVSAPAAQPVDALIEVAGSGNVEVVQRLLDTGVDPDAQTGFQESALMAAASNRHADVVELLLARGADPNLRDMHGQTPLFMAAYERQAEIVKLLLERGAEVDAPTAAGETALLRAVFWESREIVDLLVAAGAEPDRVGDAVLAGVGFKDRAEWNQRVRDVQAGR